MEITFSKGAIKAIREVMILVKRLLVDCFSDLYIVLDMLLYIIREINSKEVLRIKLRIYYNSIKVIIILRINSKKVVTKVIYNRLIFKL